MDKFVIPCSSSAIHSDVIIFGAVFVDIAAFIGAALFVAVYDVLHMFLSW